MKALILTALTVISFILQISCKKDDDIPGTVTEPVVTTNEVSSITQTSAISGGNITDDGVSEITKRGVCWSTTENPTTADSKTIDGSGSGDFTSTITGLTPLTIYYIRAYGVNSAGTGYGNQLSFTTAAGIGAIVFNPDLTYGTLSDVEGNVYKTIQIGAQTWMAENLKTTKYNDGTLIPHVADENAWSILSTQGYCWYNNDSATYKAAYGGLYNWFAVDTASNGGKNVCPTGWHVPTYDEWSTLTDYLGGADIAGGKLKEAGTTHWVSPNAGATNESGFTAIPSGARAPNYGFFSGGLIAAWWTTNEGGISAAYAKLFIYENNIVTDMVYTNEHGLSVRCLKE